LYYGDYEGILANYLAPHYNVGLIISGLQKCLAYGETEKAQHILEFIQRGTPKKIDDLTVQPCTVAKS
jgi:hypothetical protein